ncbi:MAG TPA: type IV pilus modification protein PilV [Steroidobacteraceae bacterium]|nr:type IV pilus modification protein PilV [Steroidobacteraceae bacterium]
MNTRVRGFTLVESLIALLLLSLGLLGAGVMLLESLRAHAEALRAATATRLVRDMAERIRANPHARAQYDTPAGIAGGSACEFAAACDSAQRAASDLAHFISTTRATFPGADTSARIEFEPAIGPAAPDRYRISLQWRGPRDNDAVRHSVTLVLLTRPVAGQA